MVGSGPGARTNHKEPRDDGPNGLIIGRLYL